MQPENHHHKLLSLWLFFALFFLTSWKAVSEEADTPTRSITVYAASSLTAAFEEMGRAFQSRNPEWKVSLNFGGSPQLRTQLELGAKADLYAPADKKQMDLALQSGIIQGASTPFAHNQLLVILPGENRAGIKSLPDLVKPGIKIVLAAPEVPVGNYSRLFLEKAGNHPGFPKEYKEQVLANVVSEEPNVKQVVAKILLDEADAGIVYGTDLTSQIADKLKKLEIPAELNQQATYYIALTKTCELDQAAMAFIEFVLGEPGQKILSHHGFIGISRHPEDTKRKDGGQ